MTPIRSVGGRGVARARGCATLYSIFGTAVCVCVRARARQIMKLGFVRVTLIVNRHRGTLYKIAESRMIYKCYCLFYVLIHIQELWSPEEVYQEHQ